MQQLLDELDRCFAQDPSPTALEAARQTLIAGTAGVQQLLANVLERPGLVAAVAKDSYWHANGFAKLILWESPSGSYRIRLHAWMDPSVPLRQSPNIHSHQWNFVSLVLSGTGVEISNFEVDDSGSDYYAFNCFRGGDGNTILEPAGRSGLRQVKHHLVERGSAYVCHTADLHVAKSLPGEPVYTLVAQGRSRRDTSSVYSKTERPTLLAEVENTLSPRVVKDLLEAAHRAAS